MVFRALLGKYLSCLLAEKTSSLVPKPDGIRTEHRSGSSYPITAVLVGYNVILGETGRRTDTLAWWKYIKWSHFVNSCFLHGKFFFGRARFKKLVAEEGLQEYENSTESDNKTLIAINNPGMINSLVELGIMLTQKGIMKNYWH